MSALKGLRRGAHSFTQRGCRMPEFQALVYSLWGEKTENKNRRKPLPSWSLTIPSDSLMIKLHGTSTRKDVYYLVLTTRHTLC